MARNFSEALKKARGDRSQAEFARLLGIPSQQTYQRYEGGLVPNGVVLLRIANKLGTTVDELLQGGKQQRPAPAEWNGNDYIPWGFEHEEMVQASIGFSALARATSSKGLFWAITQILNNSKVSERAKIYWVKALGEWACLSSELEEKGLGQGEHSELVDKAIREAKTIDTLPGEAYDSATEMKNLWQPWKNRLQKVCAPDGAKARCARELQVSRQLVSKWLEKTEPTADFALRLIGWIEKEERAMAGK